MKAKKYIDEQITAVLREGEAVVNIFDKFVNMY